LFLTRSQVRWVGVAGGTGGVPDTGVSVMRLPPFVSSKRLTKSTAPPSILPSRRCVTVCVFSSMV
jgi:hypothetical protein